MCDVILSCIIDETPLSLPTCVCVLSQCALNGAKCALKTGEFKQNKNLVQRSAKYSKYPLECCEMWCSVV